MSHIHIPDGVLPIGWWLVGFLVAIGILLIALRKLEREDVRKRVPYLGVVSALMLITMSVPVGALPFHINLTILTGILAGPWLGYVAVFLVNLFLSFLGHGGITVVGVNTLILGSEVFIGWAIFRLLRKGFKDLAAVGIATVLALVISTTLMLGIIGGSQLGWGYALPHQHQGEEHGSEAELIEEANQEPEDEYEFEHGGPLEVMGEQAGAGHSDSGTAGAEHESLAVATGGAGSAGADFFNLSALQAQLAEVSFFKFTGLGALLTILIIGIGLEVMVTVLMVRFFKKVRPDLLN